MGAVNKVFLVGTGSVLLLIGLFIFFFNNSSVSTNTVGSLPTSTIVPNQQDTKASFAIFTNNTFRIFTDPKYHNQSNDVYMEEANIVTVKKKGITWNDFFKTLPMKLTKDCLTTGTGQVFCTNDSQALKFYINGEMDTLALDKEIKEKDKLLVTYGNKSYEEIEKELQQIPTID